MRTIISCGGFVFIIAILMLTHTAIISKNIRDNQVNCSLESATDYALDCMLDQYQHMIYKPEEEEYYIDQLLQCFCEALNRLITTDGDINVTVLTADIKTGTFDFIVEETYPYPFAGRTGICVCERAVRLQQ